VCCISSDHGRFERFDAAVAEGKRKKGENPRRPSVTYNTVRGDSKTLARFQARDRYFFGRGSDHSDPNYAREQTIVVTKHP